MGVLNSAEELDDRITIGYVCLHTLAWINAQQGYLKEAYTFADRGLHIMHEAGDPIQKAYALRIAGQVSRKMAHSEEADENRSERHFEEAQTFYEEALEYAISEHDYGLIANLRGEEGKLQRDAGHFAQAKQSMTEACYLISQEPLYEPYLPLFASLLRHRARIEYEERRYDEAKALCEKCLGIAGEMISVVADARLLLAKVRRDQGAIGAALQLALRSSEEIEQLGNYPLRGESAALVSALRNRLLEDDSIEIESLQGN